MPEIEIVLRVNGRAVQWRVQPGETLLEALHSHYLKGTKLICGTGDCCGCGVILDGRSINACCTLAAQADGAELLTIEGLAQDGTLHPIQEAFAEEGAAQCGFCTPASSCAPMPSCKNIHILVRPTCAPRWVAIFAGAPAMSNPSQQY